MGYLAGGRRSGADNVSLTNVSSVLMSKGLTNNPAAPREAVSARAWLLPRAVVMIRGAAGMAPPCNFRATSAPDISGRIRSMITRSGRCCAAAATPASPVWASVTSWPSRPKMDWYSRHNELLSSITSILATVYQLNLSRGQRPGRGGTPKKLSGTAQSAAPRHSRWAQ